MRRFHNFFVWGIVFAYLLALAVLSLSPFPKGMPGTQLVSSTVLHVLAYAGLGILLRLIWSWKGSVLVSASYGGLLEIFQLFVPGRFFSMMDFGANTTGALLGCLLVGVLIKEENVRNVWSSVSIAMAR